MAAALLIVLFTCHVDPMRYFASQSRKQIKIRWFFLMVGARPNTAWLGDLMALDYKGFVKTGVLVGSDSPYAASQPGIFAVCDVRAGSVKRVASSVGEGSVVISKVWEYVHSGLAGV